MLYTTWEQVEPWLGDRGRGAHDKMGDEWAKETITDSKRNERMPRHFPGDPLGESNEAVFVFFAYRRLARSSKALIELISKQIPER